MNKRMLIDTSHAEETRVVVLDGNRLEDYDVETSAKKQLKGNIYLAKVVRVEPSLQAAFVEYGGNRHGFLAFSEIHPDYYQIPVADREKLIALQEEEARAEEARAEAEESGEPSDAAAPAAPGTDETAPEADGPAGDEGGDTEGDDGERPAPEMMGGEHDPRDDERGRNSSRLLRHYKIQEVIRRRQILLVQVVKEERGNKGAALTTYISLAGRYCVLMPNSLRGGGVSRKITSAADRKRLKEITSELQIPRGMGMIVRTAGAQRPRPEIMRDCEYLLQLWDDIRETTMASMAPALIYEEASLIKRAIRDVYTREVEEILVDGEPGWKGARDFMRMLMPDHARKVQLWNGAQPLFSHYQVEGHLDSMLNPTVQLRSGGYLVINQTEALVAIDVNSGRSTRERGIEETALRTNLEAADEVARQLRLRDLAGLIVIDFIDMESRKHNGMVERRLKEALKNDRARIQVGSISHFGLMEMSRQRLRPSIAESSFNACPHCGGTGMVRGTESAALHVLRAIEEEGAKRRAAEILVHVAGPVALYILNNKRLWLAEIEARYGMVVSFAADDSLLPSQLRIDRTRALVAPEPAAQPAPAPTRPVQAERVSEAEPAENEGDEDEVGDENGASASDASQDDAGQDGNGQDGDGQRRRKRRRRRRGGRREDGEHPVMPEGTEQPDMAAQAPSDEQAPVPVAFPDHDAFAPRDDAGTDAPDAPYNEGSAAADGPRDENDQGRNRRRGRRGGRRRREQGDLPDQTETARTENGAEARQPAAPAPLRGPTPADPFAGSFDIFDVMDEAEEAPRPAPSAPATNTVEPPVMLPGAASAGLAAEAEVASPTEAPAASESVQTDAPAEEAPTPVAASADVTAEAVPTGDVAAAAEAEAPKKRPARSRRKAVEAAPDVAEAEPAKPRRATRSRKAAPDAVADAAPDAAPDAVAETAAEEPAKKPARTRRKAVPAEIAAESVTEVPVAETAEPAPDNAAPAEDHGPKPVLVGADAPTKPRTGWWRR